MKHFFALLIAFAGLTAAAQAATETRAVAPFKGIVLAGSIDLVVNQGAQASVQVQADDKLLPMIETVVEGDRLQVRVKRGEHRYTMRKVTVTIVTPVLNALSIAGSGDAVLNALNTGELAISISGSGDVRGSGQAKRLSVQIAGSGDVHLREMLADEVSVRIAGSGDAEVNAQKTLSVSIAGSGDVVYSGDAVVKSSVAGSGSVTRK